jgi:hypothetical protein
MIGLAVERIKSKAAVSPDRVFEFGPALKAAEGLR